MSERPSWTTYAGPILTAPNVRTMWRMYADRADLRHPHLSPLHASTLAGLPPAVVVTAQHEHGRDDAAEYVQRLNAARIPADFVAYDGLCHGFLSLHAQVPACLDALDGCCARIRRALDARRRHARS